MDGTESAFPARLARVQEQLEQWRSTRTRRTIPEELWSAAARMARDYGVGYTSRALRLDYYGLKRRLESSCDEEEEDRGAKFVELAPLPGGSGGDAGESGMADLEDGRGSRIRVMWRGRSPDLTALSRSFFGGGR
jgi:hypothetical protein